MERKLETCMEGTAIWLYGLSGAGKTTVSRLLQKKLTDTGYKVIVLDGDELRSGISNDLTFSVEYRTENIRRVSEIAKLLVKNKIVVICALITPLKEHRTLARNIIGKKYCEIFIDCPLALCETRDVKGFYKLSREKKIKDFTGIDSGFESTNDSDLAISTAVSTPEEATNELYRFVLSRLK